MGVASLTGFGSGVYARWLDFPGEQLIAQVEVEIGGQRIDRQYGDWMHIWNQLTMTSEQQRGYFKMIGNTTQLTFITEIKGEIYLGTNDFMFINNIDTTKESNIFNYIVEVLDVKTRK